MRFLKLDEGTGCLDFIDIDDNIRSYYRELECSCIDTATLAYIEPECRIVAIVDDVGFFSRKPTCCINNSLGFLFGSVLFARHYLLSPDFSDILPEDKEVIMQYLISI